LKIIKTIAHFFPFLFLFLAACSPSPAQSITDQSKRTLASTPVVTTNFSETPASPVVSSTQNQNEPSAIQQSSPTRLELTSLAFNNGEPIPVEYTCDGKGMSPPMAWQGIPKGAMSLTMISDDPDAPGGIWTHWVLYNIPPNRTDLPEGVKSGETVEGIGVQGKTSSNKMEYDGPCPPKGTGIHHYSFKIFALDVRLFLKPGVTKDDVLTAMQGHIIKEAEITGTYKNKNE
jgi:Raf kinase inhibitor-like YbhB/YbcL family protein